MSGQAPTINEDDSLPRGRLPRGEAETPGTGGTPTLRAPSSSSHSINDLMRVNNLEALRSTATIRMGVPPKTHTQS